MAEDDIPLLPVGTLKELEEHGFDPAVYRSCAKPVKDPDNTSRFLTRGCPSWETCTLSCKGKSGPRNYGVEIIKGPAFGSAVVRRTLHCTTVVSEEERHRLNDGVLRIIADEGERYDTIEIVRGVDAQGRPTQQEKVFTGENGVLVPRHPRPNENPALVRDRLVAMARKAELERQKDERVAPALGIRSKPTPLDKRGREKSGEDASGKPLA